MASGKGNTFITDWLNHVFNNAAIPLVGDAAGLQPAATVGSLYVSLHTANPGAAGTQTTSEAAYISYARVAVARTAGGWTVSGQSVSNTAAVIFPQCTGGSETETYVGIGTATSGAGKLLYFGQLTASLAVSNLITPEFLANQLVITEA